MKAVWCPRYGGPEHLEVRDVPRPTSGPGQVLVEVRAAAVNALDYHFMRGTPWPVRLMAGLRRPKQGILGADVAGVVRDAAPEVTTLRVGDDVFGDTSGGRLGAFAEFVAVDADQLVRMPPRVSYDEAAAVPVAAVTALQAVRDQAATQAGQEVLVTGAAGGVGHFAVQIAKAMGATVSASCSAAKAETARRSGAEHVFDRRSGDALKQKGRYHAIIDTAAFEPLSTMRRILRPDGVYVAVGGPDQMFFRNMALFPALSRSKGQRLRQFVAKSNPGDLQRLADWLADGTLRPVIERRVPLEGVPGAIGHLEQGKANGKTVVVVSADPTRRRKR